MSRTSNKIDWGKYKVISVRMPIELGIEISKENLKREAEGLPRLNKEDIVIGKVAESYGKQNLAK